MLTIKDYKKQLQVADIELIKAYRADNDKRIGELLDYRIMLLEDLVEALEKKIIESVRKAA